MHVKDILRALKKRPTAREVRNLRQVIYPFSKKGKVFTRTGVETFGLASWDSAPVYPRSRQGVRAILLAHGKPTHGDDILKAFGETATTPNRCRLASMLNQWVLKGIEFTRPAPSTWGLLDWKDPGLSLTKKRRSNGIKALGAVGRAKSA